jgi:hypothetical protein
MSRSQTALQQLATATSGLRQSATKAVDDTRTLVVSIRKDIAAIEKKLTRLGSASKNIVSTATAKSAHYNFEMGHCPLMTMYRREQASQKRVPFEGRVTEVELHYDGSLKLTAHYYDAESAGQPFTLDPRHIADFAKQSPKVASWLAENMTKISQAIDRHSEGLARAAR